MRLRPAAHRGLHCGWLIIVIFRLMFSGPGSLEITEAGEVETVGKRLLYI